MSDVKYDAELCERLIASVRTRYAKFGAVGSADALDMADQLAAARAEIDRLEALVSVSPDDIRNVVVENDRMHEAFDQAMKKLRAGSTLVKSAMCTWCGQHWPMLDGEPIETFRKYTNEHANQCPANDIRIERDKLRAEIERLRLIADIGRAYVRITELDKICDLHGGMNDDIGIRAEGELADLVATVQPMLNAYRAARNKAGGS